MLIRVNGGRLRFFERISSVKKLRPGHFEARVDIWNKTFHIEGGRHAGGRRIDWFLDGFGEKAIHCKSLVDALNLIETA